MLKISAPLAPHRPALHRYSEDLADTCLDPRARVGSTAAPADAGGPPPDLRRLVACVFIRRIFKMYGRGNAGSRRAILSLGAGLAAITAATATHAATAAATA